MIFKKAPLVTTFSFSAVFNEVGPFLSFPREISRVTEIKTELTTKDRRSPYWVDEMYESSKKLILNFEQQSDDLVEEISQKNIDRILEKYKANKQKLEKNYEEVDDFLVELKKDVILDLNSPTTFFNAKRFYKLSKHMFKTLSKLDGELKTRFKKYNERELQEKLEKRLKNNKKLAKFSIFVSLQLYFIVAYVLADLRNDMEFLTEYKKLLNKFSHFLAKRNLELYEKIFETGEVKYKSQGHPLHKNSSNHNLNTLQSGQPLYDF